MWTPTEKIVIGAVFLTACASMGPSEALLDARQMYQRAERSRAPELAPAHLREAERALAKAEAEHSSDPQSTEEKHLAYLAIAKMETAMAEARRRHARQREEIAHRRYFTEHAQLRRQAEAQIAELKKSYFEVRSLLESTQTELDAVHTRLRTEQNLESAQLDQLKMQRRTLDEQVQLLDAKRQALEQALAERNATLEVEREARIRAEQEADEALDRLQEIASIREEEDGTIITLTGSVLFATGQSRLLPSARDRLARVADALRLQDERVGIVIEGHTDTKGPKRANDELSHARANAVKQYLVEQGVAENRIRAIGRGESEPIATNRTPEGRANNRRVEIILDEET